MVRGRCLDARGQKRADTAYQQKNYTNAVMLYTMAIESSPKDGATWDDDIQAIVSTPLCYF